MDDDGCNLYIQLLSTAALVQLAGFYPGFLSLEWRQEEGVYPLSSLSSNLCISFESFYYFFIIFLPYPLQSI